MCAETARTGLELFADAGFDGYHFEWQVDAKTAVEKIGDRMCLVGNVNNPEVLYQGTPEDVYARSDMPLKRAWTSSVPNVPFPWPPPLKI
jgi:uroporphyrinogen-III decarboxylase